MESIKLRLTEALPAGAEVTVTVVRIHGQTARVGVDAPAEVFVIRSEIDDGRDVLAKPGRGE